MCGIVGYVGKRPVQDLLLAGLTRLEYRGYDSAGISMIEGESIESVRAVGNLDHLREAVAERRAEPDGHFAFVAMRRDEPEVLVGARKECPLVVGRGEGETFLASAIPAFLRETHRVQYIENGEIVVITPEGATFLKPDGTEVEREVHEIDWDDETAEKGGYETLMLKEIHEQADAVAETIADRTLRDDGVDLDEAGALDEAILRDVKRIVVVACGTSYHAGLIGRYALEE